MMSYRKQRALKRLLSGRNRLKLRRAKNITFSEKSLQKAKDHVREHITLQQLPSSVRKVKDTKTQKKFIQYQQEVKLAKLLDRRMPDNSPGEILKLPIPKLSFLEGED
ncbi:MAG: hypothetical protein GY786_11300 [Proteobacteria bacterium]|nr:hypothetical protein [Pseudomonadota bacterium]